MDISSKENLHIAFTVFVRVSSMIDDQYATNVSQSHLWFDPTIRPLLFLPFRLPSSLASKLSDDEAHPSLPAPLSSRDALERNRRTNFSAASVTGDSGNGRAKWDGPPYKPFFVSADVSISRFPVRRGRFRSRRSGGGAELDALSRGGFN